MDWAKFGFDQKFTALIRCMGDLPSNFYENTKKMPKKQLFFNFGDVFLRGEVSVQLFIKIVGEKFFGLVSLHSSCQKRAGA